MRRQIFTDKKDSGQPITVNRVYQTAKGFAFYNSFRGSSLDNIESIDFKFDETKCVSLRDLTTKSSGSFSVEGMIQRRAPEVALLVKKKQVSAEGRTEVQYASTSAESAGRIEFEKGSFVTILGIFQYLCGKIWSK